MKKWKPHHFLPKVVSTRELLTRKQHEKLLSQPNFRHDQRLPQPPKPNLAIGPEPIWPIAGGALKAKSTPRIIRLCTPRPSSTKEQINTPEESVSRRALKAKPSRRIMEMANPRVAYMVGLTMDMQEALGEEFREKMRKRIIGTLGTSYATLALRAKASEMRDFYANQSRREPLEPYTNFGTLQPMSVPPSRTQSAVSKGSKSSKSSASRKAGTKDSASSRLEWEASRAQPKRDFTIYQQMPERKKAPYKKLLPRIEALSTPPQRYRIPPEAWDPFKVSPGAKIATASERIAQLARPRLYVTAN